MKKKAGSVTSTPGLKFQVNKKNEIGIDHIKLSTQSGKLNPLKKGNGSATTKPKQKYE